MITALLPSVTLTAPPPISLSATPAEQVGSHYLNALARSLLCLCPVGVWQAEMPLYAACVDLSGRSRCCALLPQAASAWRVATKAALRRWAKARGGGGGPRCSAFLPFLISLVPVFPATCDTRFCGAATTFGRVALALILYAIPALCPHPPCNVYDIATHAAKLDQNRSIAWR